MKSKKFSEAMSEIDNRYINEAIHYKKNAKKNSFFKWGAIAACLCLICIGGFLFSYVVQNQLQPSAPQVSILPTQKQTFVLISSLLEGSNSYSNEAAEETAAVSIEQYKGVYVKTISVDSDTLSENIGSAVSGTEAWYYVSGHTDLQYLIQNDNDVYSLWKFKCFDSDEYPYSDVLKLVYKIDSADKIKEIQVNPATMDNTDSGKAIQKEIGTHTVTDDKEIETIYQILSSLTCYGENKWDMIDYGNAEAAADKETSANEAVRLGRYLTLVTSYGNEIDGLKYTEVSKMFYEFSGIAYNQLSKGKAARICKIFHIKRSVENNKTQQSSQPEEPAVSSITQARISNAMSNHKLPFVSSSAVYEKPYRLHVVVSSNAKEDLAPEIKAK